MIRWYLIPTLSSLHRTYSILGARKCHHPRQTLTNKNQPRNPNVPRRLEPKTSVLFFGWKKGGQNTFVCRFVDWFFPQSKSRIQIPHIDLFVRSIPLSECQVTFQHLGISPKWCYKTAVSRPSEIWAPRLTDSDGFWHSFFKVVTLESVAVFY